MRLPGEPGASYRSGVDIEFLYWDGCPSHPEARQLLDEVLAKHGLNVDVKVREVRTQAEADELRFPGSPTIRVEGHDVQPPGPEEPSGLTCRVYRRRDGRISPLPDPGDVREALEGAAAREGVER